VKETEPGVETARSAGGVQAIEKQKGKGVEQEVPTVRALMRKAAGGGPIGVADPAIDPRNEVAAGSPFVTPDGINCRGAIFAQGFGCHIVTRFPQEPA
jgi:hypothetical protein